MEKKSDISTRDDNTTSQDRTGSIVRLGKVGDLTGQQPRGHKADGGSINRHKDASESPRE